MTQSTALRRASWSALTLAALSISATRTVDANPAPPTHTFIVAFSFDNAPRSLRLRPELMAQELSRKLDNLSTGNIRFTPRDLDDGAEPCGQNASCDVVTVTETAGESDRSGVAIVLSVVQAKVQKRHHGRMYPLNDDVHACQYPPASKESWSTCVDLYVTLMYAELRRHVRDDHPTPSPE